MKRYKVHNNCRAFRQIIRKNKEMVKIDDNIIKPFIIKPFIIKPYKLKHSHNIGYNHISLLGWKIRDCTFF
jgi:hypothetical protein